MTISDCLQKMSNEEKIYHVGHCEKMMHCKFNYACLEGLDKYRAIEVARKKPLKDVIKSDPAILRPACKIRTLDLQIEECDLKQTEQSLGAKRSRPDFTQMIRKIDLEFERSDAVSRSSVQWQAFNHSSQGDSGSFQRSRGMSGMTWCQDFEIMKKTKQFNTQDTKQFKIIEPFDSTF